jgi:hypothetical protein
VCAVVKLLDPLPALGGGLAPGPSKTGDTVVLPTVVERSVELNGFMALVMKPRRELLLDRPWDEEPDRETVKTETATLCSDRLLAVRPLSSSPETEETVVWAAMSCARRVGDTLPAEEWKRACVFKRASAAAQSETHSWISRSRETAELSASVLTVLIRDSVRRGAEKLVVGGSRKGSE